LVEAVPRTLVISISKGPAVWDKGGDESFLFDELSEHRSLYTNRNLESWKQKPKELSPIQPRDIGSKKQPAK
jgi:hypothetical protein